MFPPSIDSRNRSGSTPSACANAIVSADVLDGVHDPVVEDELERARRADLLAEPDLLPRDRRQHLLADPPCRFRAREHHDELPLLRRPSRAQHRRVDVEQAVLVGEGREPLRPVDPDRAGLGPHGALGSRRERSLDDLGDGRPVREHRHDELGAVHGLRGRRRHLGSEAFGLRRCPVPGAHVVSGLGEPPRDRRAHEPGAEDGDLHGGNLSVARGPGCSRRRTGQTAFVGLPHDESRFVAGRAGRAGRGPRARGALGRIVTSVRPASSTGTTAAILAFMLVTLIVTALTLARASQVARISSPWRRSPEPPPAASPAHPGRIRVRPLRRPRQRCVARSLHCGSRSGWAVPVLRDRRLAAKGQRAGWARRLAAAWPRAPYFVAGRDPERDPGGRLDARRGGRGHRGRGSGGRPRANFAHCDGIAARRLVPRSQGRGAPALLGRQRLGCEHRRLTRLAA